MPMNPNARRLNSRWLRLKLKQGKSLPMPMLAIAENPQFGLNKGDIAHNINFFMNVPVTQDGGLTFEDGISAPGKYVELTALMDVVILISNCPQLNNPCNGYDPTPIEVLIWE